MALHHYSPLRTTESLTHQRSSPKPSTNYRVTTPPVQNEIVQSRTGRTMELSSADNQSRHEVPSTTSVALQRDIKSGVDIDNGETCGDTIVDYDKIIAAIMLSRGERQTDTQRSLERRNVRALAKCGPIIKDTRKGEIIDLDGDTPCPLQEIDDVNCNAQHIQNSGSLPPTDSDLTSIWTQLGLNNTSEDIIMDVFEDAPHYHNRDAVTSDTIRHPPFSDRSDTSTLSLLSQSFVSDDESNPFLRMYIDPCNIDTDPLPTPMRQSPNSNITKVDQELMVPSFEGRTKTWMHLDEFVNVQSLRSQDGIAGVLYIDDVFSELLS
ncbi:hypothetical protein V1525DRAFT_339818 [Lipomyces kononenkoae]|uniref:Uncharacterized protein n=1 Tax=Lipomyces kononenkoae TaxID=34357 RepID=A0ACC3T667_LIPKO